MSAPSLPVLDSSRADLITAIAAVSAKHGVAHLDLSPEGDVIECVCGWFYTREDHEIHRARKIAEALGLVPVFAPVTPAGDGTCTPRWLELFDDRSQAAKAAHDENLPVGTAYLTAWTLEPTTAPNPRTES